MLPSVSSSGMTRYAGDSVANTVLFLLPLQTSWFRLPLPAPLLFVSSFDDHPSSVLGAWTILKRTRTPGCPVGSLLWSWSVLAHRLDLSAPSGSTLENPRLSLPLVSAEFDAVSTSNPIHQTRTFQSIYSAPYKELSDLRLRDELGFVKQRLLCNTGFDPFGNHDVPPLGPRNGVNCELK
jgi:hypothetical protein